MTPGGGAIETDFIAVDEAEVAEGFDAKDVRFSDVSGGGGADVVQESEGVRRR